MLTRTNETRAWDQAKPSELSAVTPGEREGRRETAWDCLAAFLRVYLAHGESSG
jgi:hypothetical protein